MIQRAALVGLLLALLTSAPLALANPDQLPLRLLPVQTAREPAFPPIREVPLELNARGYVSKFIVGWWEVGSQTYDVDGDGTLDYVVWVGTRGGHTVGIVHAWGADPDLWGPAVFYSIKNAREEITEWAGNPNWPSHPPANSPELKSGAKSGF